MDDLRIWVTGAGEICYTGLCSVLSNIQGVSCTNHISVDEIEDSSMVSTPLDIYILCSCLLHDELIPLCARMRARSPKVLIIVWSHHELLNIGEVLKSGASAYVASCSPAELECAIEALSQGHQYFNIARLQSSSCKQSDPQLSPKLTPRQMQIQRLASLGFSDKEIGSTLGISAHTVRSHLRAIFERSGVRRRSGLSTNAYTLASNE